MCLAVPGKVISIEEKKEGAPRMARVDFAGVVQKVCVDWLPDLRVGEYVIVHVGFALNKIDEEDARQTLELLKEMGDLEDPESA